MPSPPRPQLFFNSNIAFLISSKVEGGTEDVRLCRMWIDKLIHCASNERQLRNVYLEQLCRHSQQQILGPPFNCPPSEGPLQTIPEQFLIMQGVVLDRSVTSTVTSQTEGETTSWSDVTSILTSSSYQQDPSGDEAQPIRKVVSTTSTRTETVVSENTHRVCFEHYNNSQSSQNRRKNQPKFKKQTCDPNEEFFKETKEDLQICKTTVVALESVDSKSSDKERKNKGKIVELEQRVSEIQKENSVLNQQLQQEKDKKIEMNILQEALKKEVLEWKDKLTLIGKIKNALEREHKEFIDSTLSALTTRVNSAIKKNDQLAEEFHLISREKKELNEQIIELKKSHSEVVLSYKNNISDLKKDISKKNKEVENVKKQLQEHCSCIKTEVENIKQEYQKSIIELKAKNTAYKSKIIKLIEHNKNVANCYEQKIEVLTKTKDMELWVQKENISKELLKHKNQELEDVVFALEEKFRKQLTNVTQITFHNTDPTTECFEKISEPDLNENKENNE
ncbi:uncharacterized protein LOC142330455 [Lycorma delicatula]|uniref:uncharacterized protein LOC142330455 n=1 Tax=Lycorma delicatula TaxID=130591 RepID=UPI003F50D4A8